MQRRVDSAIETLIRAVEQAESKGRQAHVRVMARYTGRTAGNVMHNTSRNADAPPVGEDRVENPVDHRVQPGGCDGRPADNGYRAACSCDVLPANVAQFAGSDEGTNDLGEITARLRAAAKARGITVTSVDGMGCHGNSHGGTIVIRAGLPSVEEFTTLVHELAHELLHYRDDLQLSESIRESEAEAVAYVVSNAVGRPVLQASVDYILSYLGTSQMLRDATDRIDSVSHEIIQALGIEPRATCVD